MARHNRRHSVRDYIELALLTVFCARRRMVAPSSGTDQMQRGAYASLSLMVLQQLHSLGLLSPLDVSSLMPQFSSLHSLVLLIEYTFCSDILHIVFER